MPNLIEKQFFLTAFRLMDNFDRNGYRKTIAYLGLMAESRDRRIDWKKIPGLFLPGAKGGYAAALKKVCESVINITLVDPDNIMAEKTLNILCRLSQGVWMTRVIHQYKLSQSYQDEVTTKHTGAIGLWKQARAILKENRDNIVWDHLLRFGGLHIYETFTEVYI